MAFTIQDLEKGVDFTGLPNINAGDLNNLVDQAVPKIDASLTTGRSINLWSVDTALNTPQVPDAATNTKWKKYFWIRYPHSTATSTTPLVYAWDDNTGSIATYLKWVLVIADLTAVLSDIAQLQVDVVTAQTTADAANGIANSALTASSNAQAAATAASTSAGNALSAAATAATLATAANNTANIALGNTNRKNNLVKISETRNKGTSNGAASLGANTRFKTGASTITDYDPTPFISIDTATGIITLLVAGTYRIRCQAVIYDGAVFSSQLFLIKTSDSSVLLSGLSTSNPVSHHLDEVSGVLPFGANDTIRFDHYTSDAASGGTLGNATNLAPGTGKEVYAICEIEFLGT